MAKRKNKNNDLKILNVNPGNPYAEMQGLPVNNFNNTFNSNNLKVLEEDNFSRQIDDLFVEPTEAMLKAVPEPVYRPATVQQIEKEVNKNTPKANYIIKKGDTLSKIARETGMSVAELAKMNNIKDVNKIYAGASLIINPSNYKASSPPVKKEIVKKAVYNNSDQIITPIVEDIQEIIEPSVTYPTIPNAKVNNVFLSPQQISDAYLNYDMRRNLNNQIKESIKQKKKDDYKKESKEVAQQRIDQWKSVFGFKNGGLVGNVGDEVELTQEEINYYRSLGYEFE